GAVTQPLRGLGVHLLLEPGRSIVGPAGALLVRVLYRKSNNGKSFIVVDGAMNDLIRPALYGAHHDIVPVSRAQTEESSLADVVGPICETGDFLAKEKQVPPARSGDLLAVMSAGAYGFSMSSNYNSRPRVAEVLAHGSEFHLIRARETYEHLVQGETIPDFLQAK
ncbi:MAG TPA: diaminopimelate decarboxylase, partial [Desulfurivibrionaceae bacterium]|nr:diaminopimelate decarboxylase [Desulfurivibrionaceae bacterium]